MNRQKIIIVSIIIAMLGCVFGGWIIEHVRIVDHIRREAIYENEAMKFALKVAEIYSSGESDEILSIIGGDNPEYTYTYLLPVGLMLDYIERQSIMYQAWDPSKSKDPFVLATYVIKYRIIGDIPNDLGTYIKREDIQIVGETAYLFQTVAIRMNENEKWELFLVAYGQYYF